MGELGWAQGKNTRAHIHRSLRSLSLTLCASFTTLTMHTPFAHYRSLRSPTSLATLAPVRVLPPPSAPHHGSFATFHFAHSLLPVHSLRSLTTNNKPRPFLPNTLALWARPVGYTRPSPIKDLLFFFGLFSGGLLASYLLWLLCVLLLGIYWLSVKSGKIENLKI